MLTAKYFLRMFSFLHGLVCFSFVIFKITNINYCAKQKLFWKFILYFCHLLSYTHFPLFTYVCKVCKHLKPFREAVLCWVIILTLCWFIMCLFKCEKYLAYFANSYKTDTVSWESTGIPLFIYCSVDNVDIIPVCIRGIRYISFGSVCTGSSPL